MRLKTKSAFILFLFALLLASFSLAVKPPIPDMPSRYVVDLAGIIDDGVEMRLNGFLQELEQKTTDQMVILTVNSLEGEPVEDFLVDVAHNKWKLGQKGRDNGLLFLVVPGEKVARFEIGYDLEGVLPDSLVGSIGREYLVPYFRKGDYSTGILGASLAVIHEIASEAGVQITGMPEMRTRSPYAAERSMRRKPTILGSIFTILFVIGLIYMFIRHPRLFLFLLMMNMLGGGRRGGWGGGGGFGGGGFGSFGGGGGGGFGGGGATIRW